MKRCLSIFLFMALSAGCAHVDGGAGVASFGGAVDARLEMIRRGNIVPNPFFEDVSDGTVVGWTLEGAGARADHEVPHEGKYTLRISGDEGRSRATSDRFPVVPGNYRFSLWIRMRNLTAPQGGSLEDVVRIRLDFFDSKGRPLEAVERFGGESVDRSAKSYGLASLKSIVFLDWQWIMPVSRYYPYRTGDVPKGAAFAQVKVDLNGPGTIWVDDIDLHYSRYNLTLAERIEYAETSAKAGSGILPEPRECAIDDHVIELTGPDGPALRACILLPSEPSTAERLATEELVDSIWALGGLVEDGFVVDDPMECPAGVPVLSIGDTDAAARMVAPGEWEELEALGGGDAYLVRTEEREGREWVIAAGCGPRGTYYAVNTLVQLLESGEGKILLRGVHIRDWPAYRVRAVSGEGNRWPAFAAEKEIARRLAHHRLNTICINYPAATTAWWSPPEAYELALEELGAFASETGLVDLGILVNPYYHRAGPEKEEVFRISSDDDLETLFNVIDMGLSNGASLIILCADDFVPRLRKDCYCYGLDDDADRERFGTLAAAHAHMVRFVRDRMREASPVARLLFVPPWYSIEHVLRGGGLAGEYFAELAGGMPEDVSLVWTGPTVRSTIIDDLNIDVCRRISAGVPLFLWDNTLFARKKKDFWGEDPTWAAHCSLLEPYDLDAGQKLPEALGHDGIYVNSECSELYGLRMETVGDHLWNPETYDPDFSLWRGLVDALGAKGAEDLVRVDALYWQERAILNRMTELDGQGEKGRPMRQAMEAYGGVHAELVVALERMKRRLGPADRKLLDELREVVMANERAFIRASAAAGG
ncbi:beta-N-acetylglucosaminidase domain-containing protein [Thermodesulfobacteriota bacterium]